MVEGKRWSYHLNDLSQKYLALRSKHRAKILLEIICLLIDKLIVTAELEESMLENEKKKKKNISLLGNT